MKRFIKSCIIIILLNMFSGCGFPKRYEWNSYLLENDIIKLDIIPEIGGRVLQYKLGDYGFFWVNDQLYDQKPPASGLGPEGEWLNYGGDKLWPAPQGWDNDQQWPGPPDPILDGGIYKAELLSKSDRPMAVRLTSQEDPSSGIRFSRIVRIHENTSRVSVTATMKNVDNKIRRWGIWSHTQLDAGNRHGPGYNKDYRGICPMNPNSIFPRKYAVQFGLVNNPSFQPDYQKNMMTVEYKRLVGKIGLDSSTGWIATIDGTDGYAFVQRFTYESDKEYPEHSSVGYWLNGLGEFVAWGKINTMPENPRENPYVFESELISPYASLTPGQEYTFHYDWYAAKIPPRASIVTCNDVGVVCNALAIGESKKVTVLKGRYGVFYEGEARLVFYDANENQILSQVLSKPVTPLQYFDAGTFPGFRIPDQAVVIAISITDEDGNRLGELDRFVIR